MAGATCTILYKIVTGILIPYYIIPVVLLIIAKMIVIKNTWYVCTCGAEIKNLESSCSECGTSTEQHLNEQNSYKINKKRNDQVKGLLILAIISACFLIAYLTKLTPAENPTNKEIIHSKSTKSASELLIHGKNSTYNVVFCEKVNDQIEPIKQNTSFTSGEVGLIITSKEPFDITEIDVKVYRSKDKENYELYISDSIQVNKDWGKVYVPVNIPDNGSYHLDVIKNGKIVGEGNLTIK
jgi:hypothetical protein